jgi:hypothetical protein
MVIATIWVVNLEYLVKILIEVGVEVGIFLPTPTPPKIPSDSDSLVLVILNEDECFYIPLRIVCTRIIVCVF